MFRSRREPGAGAVAVLVEGQRILVPAGASAAAAFLVAGLAGVRESPVDGAPRAPYCMMGVCFECLAEIDGVPNRQSCMVEARAGMRLNRQLGARKIAIQP